MVAGRFKKRRRFKIDPGGTLALTHVHEETCPFRITPCFLYFKISDNTLSSLPEIRFSFSFKIIKPCAKLYRMLLRYQENHLSLQKF